MAGHRRAALIVWGDPLGTGARAARLRALVDRLEACGLDLALCLPDRVAGTALEGPPAGPQTPVLALANDGEDPTEAIRDALPDCGRILLLRPETALDEAWARLERELGVGT